MKIRKKDTQEIGSSSQFNIHSAAPQEIIVYFNDWTDTDYMSNYEVWIEAKKEWKEFGKAFADKDIITDNYNTRFFEPPNKEDRDRGFTL
jgi:hypothetical protein